MHPYMFKGFEDELQKIAISEEWAREHSRRGMANRLRLEEATLTGTGARRSRAVKGGHELTSKGNDRALDLQGRLASRKDSISSRTQKNLDASWAGVTDAFKDTKDLKKSISKSRAEKVKSIRNLNTVKKVGKGVAGVGVLAAGAYGAKKMYDRQRTKIPAKSE
jgi:hypothetical protein